MRLRSIGRLARLLLIAAPPLLIGFLIFRDGVDTPFWDEWDGTAPLFEKMAAGTLGFADFFAQHDNFLWGFQIGFLLPLACVTGCIWVAT